MCHNLEDFEYRHSKYAQSLRPGNVHVYYFSTAALSFVDRIKAAPKDVFRIAMAEFGVPLRNGIVVIKIALTSGWVVTF